MEFYRLQIKHFFSVRKHSVDTDITNEVRSLRQVLLHVWSYNLYDITLSTKKQQRHLIKLLTVYVSVF